VLYQTQKTVFDHVTFPDTEKGVETMMCSGVFLTNFELFGNVGKHSLQCVMYLLN